MNAYTEYMARQIAEEIKSIEDPMILAIYMRAIQFQRCRIGGAREGTCKECMFECYTCRQITDIVNRELEIYSDDGEES